MENYSTKYNLFDEAFRNKERLIRFATGYVYDRQVAEDLVMDSFLYYLEKRDTLNADDNVYAYILVVLKHKCIDYLRTLKVIENAKNQIQEDLIWDLNMNIESLESFDPYKLFDDDFKQIINTAIHNLPEKTRYIFLLSREKNMKYSEIAKSMNISVKTVEYHMSKAIKSLRIELKDLYFLIPLIINIS